MQLITTTNSPITMSSLEMVEFINSQRGDDASELRHDHFMAKVPQVLGEEDAPKFRGIYKDSMNREKPCYNFPKREACLMAMSYSYELQAKVFDRMTELEGGKPKSRLELAKEQVRLIEELEQAEKKVEVLKITLDESHQWASVKRMEAKYKQEFKWRKLKAYCVEHDIPIKDVFDQNYGTVKAWRADVWQAVFGVEV